MTETTQEEARPKFMPMTNADFARVFGLGALVGLLTYGLARLLDTYVFHQLLCQGDAAQCGSSLQYGEATAAILVAIAALVGLVRLRVFRPMIVVVAATVGLWGLVGQTTALEWYWAALASLALYALAYALFAWVVRIRIFWLALVVTIVLVVLIRLAMAAG